MNNPESTQSEVVPAVVTPTFAAQTPVERWWSRHCDRKRWDHDAGVPARLRRTKSARDAMRIPAAIELALAYSRRPDDPRFEAGLELARVLAHVKERTYAHPMRDAGFKNFPRQGSQEAPKRLSVARFNRLLEVGEDDDIATAFIRLVRQLEGKASVRELSAAFMKWKDAESIDDVKRDWAFKYYAAGQRCPVDPTTPEEIEE